MHIQFPSLEQYADVYARETYAQRQSRTYGAKIKLHGTNVSVCLFPDGSIEYQSRKEILTPETDIHGFVAKQTTLPWKSTHCEPLFFYGEWAGPSINKGDAITRTDKPRFYLFAVGVGIMPHPQNASLFVPASMITHPDSIRSLLPFAENDDVRVLDFEGFYTFDYTDETSLEDTLETLNDAVDAISVEDPYVARTFGIHAPGEGLVLTLITTQTGELDGATYGRRSFKAKTEKHRVRKQRKPAEKVQAIPENLPTFLDTYVTPQRLEQAIQSLNNPGKAQTGAVLAWMVEDVLKESSMDRGTLGIDDPTLRKAITQAARTLWLAHCP